MKYGQGVDIIEGENMPFVQNMTMIDHYSLYTKPSTKKNYIIIEDLERDTLASRYLTGAQKIAIVAKLRCLCEELRQLPWPNYFVNLG